jgi:hypothetical protein
LGKIFNNVFVELVRNSDGSVKELNVLDSTNLEVITKPNGDLLKLKSVTPHPVTGVYATWEESEIVWFKFGDMTKGYAPVDLRALWETLLIKSYVTQYISWLWKTGQYKLLYQFSAGTPTQDINDFLVYLRKAEGNYQSPLILKGELETKIVRDIKELDSIQNLLKYLDNQVLILLRIPPVDAGIPDASGRSNADAQSNNLHTHITSWKTIVEDLISNDLFPKMNKGNNIIRFAPNDRFAVKQMFETLQIMQSIGMTQDAMKEYMLDSGFAFNTSEMFTPPMQTGVLPNNPRKLDMMPSRTGKGTSEGNKPADAPTTRPDQLKKV